MRHPFPHFSLLFILLLTLAPASLAQTITGKVVGVSDGDTIKVVTSANKLYKVRLNGVDCPETSQPFGATAKQWTSQAVFGQQVRVVVKSVDQYGRTLGVVFLNGRNVNQGLVLSGMAWWYRRYAPRDAALKQLEAKARSAKRGLWADKTPVAPWQWRQAARSVR